MKTTIAVLALATSASAMQVSEATTIATMSNAAGNWCDMSCAQRGAWVRSKALIMHTAWRAAVTKYYKDVRAAIAKARAAMSAARGCAARRKIYYAYRAERQALYKAVIAKRTQLHNDYKKTLADFMKTKQQCEEESESESTVEESEDTVEESTEEEKESTEEEKESTEEEKESETEEEEESEEDNNCVAAKTWPMTCDRGIKRLV